MSNSIKREKRKPFVTLKANSCGEAQRLAFVERCIDGDITNVASF